MVLALLLAGVAALGGAAPAQAQQASPRAPQYEEQYERAETAWRSGSSLLEAKARLDQVLAAYPDDVEALKLRARVLMQMERAGEAVQDARRAVEVAPADGEAHLVLSEAARLYGNRALAEQELDAAANRITTGTDLHVRMSWNAAMLNQIDRAEALARIALAQDASNAEAYYQLARVFVQKGEPDQAAAVLERGLQDSVVEPRVIRLDALLSEVQDHPALRPYMRRP